MKENIKEDIKNIEEIIEYMIMLQSIIAILNILNYLYGYLTA